MGHTSGQAAGDRCAARQASRASSLFWFGLVGEDDDGRIWHDKEVLGAIYMNLCHPITVIRVTLDWQDFLPYGYGIGWSEILGQKTHLLFYS